MWKSVSVLVHKGRNEKKLNGVEMDCWFTKGPEQYLIKMYNNVAGSLIAPALSLRARVSEN